MPERMIIASSPMLLWIAGAAGVLWWKAAHSQRRIQAWASAARRQAEAAHVANFSGGNRDG